jgi:hypothetical protein
VSDLKFHKRPAGSVKANDDRAAYQRERRAVNPEASKAYNRRSYQKHKAKRLEAIKARLQAQAPQGTEARAQYYRRVQLKALYDLTTEEYDSLLEAQEGSCAICTVPFELTRAHVDHDHTTGHVRGLLCGSCNRGLGLLRDDKHLLARAIVYLEPYTK